jgi:phosphate transport system permease protein
MAIPTIFSLAEDAINNVPRAFKEASLALGATRLQTIVRITIPAALSGIMAAILLGFGRVVGETMVVLLCAGNRIQIPDLSKGVGVIFQPVHTMTGIIAQEMGEVVRYSIHYRALFMVGVVLFLISLLINFLAQKIVRRYRISIG